MNSRSGDMPECTGRVEPETDCATNPKNNKACGEGCCAKQKDNDMTCHWDGAACVEGDAPTEPPMQYNKCVAMDTMYKGKAKKKGASDAVDCFEKCAKLGKKCKGWSYIEGEKKSCHMFKKTKKSKDAAGTVSG